MYLKFIINSTNYPLCLFQSGKFKVRAVLTSKQDDDEDAETRRRRKRQSSGKIVLQDEKEAFIQVKTVLSGLQLMGPANCTDMGEVAMLVAFLENGDDFTFTWNVDTFPERSYSYGTSIPYFSNLIVVYTRNNLTWFYSQRL